MKETWHFINTKSNNPYYNMAVDEALMNFVSRGEIDPVIRFYTWDPATLSIGYFQKLTKEIEQKKGCYFSRMSGSGSVCYGVFESEKTAKAALKVIKLKHPKYWSHVAKTI